MPFASKAQQRLFYAKMNAGEMPASTVKEWTESTKKQPGGFKGLPEKVTDAEKAEERKKVASLLAAIRECGLEQQAQPRARILKFAFNQMVTPAIRGAGMPAFSGISTTVPMAAPVAPAGAQPQLPKVKTLGGNTPSTNPIGLLGQLPTTAGAITGNASFSGSKIKPM